MQQREKGYGINNLYIFETAQICKNKNAYNSKTKICLSYKLRQSKERKKLIRWLQSSTTFR